MFSGKFRRGGRAFRFLDSGDIFSKIIHELILLPEEAIFRMGRTTMAAQYMMFRDAFHQLGNILSVSLVIFHFHKHIKLMRVMYHPRTRGLVRRYPKIAYKYLVKYASLNLPTRGRLVLVTSH